MRKTKQLRKKKTQNISCYWACFSATAFRLAMPSSNCFSSICSPQTVLKILLVNDNGLFMVQATRVLVPSSARVNSTWLSDSTGLYIFILSKTCDGKVDFVISI